MNEQILTRLNYTNLPLPRNADEQSMYDIAKVLGVLAAIAALVYAALYAINTQNSVKR